MVDCEAEEESERGRSRAATRTARAIRRTVGAIFFFFLSSLDLRIPSRVSFQRPCSWIFSSAFLVPEVDPDRNLWSDMPVSFGGIYLQERMRMDESKGGGNGQSYAWELVDHFAAIF
jgi:hypothetical protein